MSTSSKLTANQISLSLTKIKLLKFQFDDSKRDAELLLMFGFHIIFIPAEKIANVGVNVSVTNPEITDVSPACEMVTHFEFALSHKEGGRALIELNDDGDEIKSLRKELALFLAAIAHSTVRGMWFMATRGTEYHEGFDIHLPTPDIDRIRFEVRQSSTAPPDHEAE
jgi:hypothetical protein